MGDSLYKFMLNRADPVSFFGGSSTSSSTVDPYTISLTSSPSSSSASHPAPSTSAIATQSSSPSPSANSFLFGDDRDIATHLLETYTLSLVSAPLVAVETLAEVQYQRRDDDDQDADSELAAYETIHHTAPDGQQLTHRIPVLNGGVWDNVRDVVETEGEGWTALIKGHLTSHIYNAIYMYVQPSLEEAINDALDVYEDTHPVTHVLSHMIVGGALSPLELIRTRLIVQTSVQTAKRYHGPIHALAAATQEEGGGILALYAAQHLIPTVIVHGLRALLRSLSTRIIRDDLGLSADFHPTLHRIAAMGFLALEVAVVTPLEMARKRLQVQRLRQWRAKAGERAQPFVGSVEMAPRVYSGMWGALYGIIVEEGGGVSRRSPKRKRSAAKTSSPVVGNSSASAAAGFYAGDWQDVYDTGASSSKMRSSKKRSSVSRFGKYWAGFSSLYRGYWARYSAEIVRFAFCEIREADQWRGI